MMNDYISVEEIISRTNERSIEFRIKIAMEAFFKSYNDQLDEAERENEKLRQLVHDIWNVMWTCPDRWCPHHHDGCYRVFGNGTSMPRGQGECWFEKRMAKLGIMEGDSE